MCTLNESAQQRRGIKSNLIRPDTKFSTNCGSDSVLLQRKRRVPSSSNAISSTSKRLESTICEESGIRGSSSKKITPVSVTHQRRRMCSRRYSMMPHMLKGDCHKIRRLFQQGNYDVSGHNNQQQSRKKYKVATSEEPTKHLDSTDPLFNESIELVKHLGLLTLLCASPRPSSSPTKL